MTSNTKTAIIFGLAVFGVVIDRLAKALVLHGVSLNTFFPVISFRLHLNPYLAFSLPLPSFISAVTIALIIIVMILLMLRAIKKNQSIVALVFFIVILGACSNLYDRLIYGGVIDYCNVFNINVFNLADVMILCGIIGLASMKFNDT
ncbi:MAG: signal peptidase II [Candidatus Falkowbacteria bacterium]